ncbi:unnamed protein product [Prorocentrum cordatum]|uniref:BTB domain-containing protein n=1 Tax=Prorocentrum cordatum TaxID=2364126 RepID=A0ABN9YH41_9DINO|nr:unnamed protein product [Polarella glacialis]
MVYEDRTLSFGHCGHPHLKAPFRLDPLDYLPCISIGKEGVKIRVSVDAPERKRKLADADDGAAALKIARTLWSDRAFSDAVVVSPPRSIAVHRCVLAAASPFFARAFQGCMRESSEARVVIRRRRRRCGCRGGAGALPVHGRGRQPGGSRRAALAGAPLRGARAAAPVRRRHRVGPGGGQRRSQRRGPPPLQGRGAHLGSTGTLSSTGSPRTGSCCRRSSPARGRARCLRGGGVRPR